MEYIELCKDNNTILRGMYHSSGNMDAIPVVIIHGYFSANRIGPQRLFVKLSEKIASNKFDVYRFDLSGMGESDGDITEIEFNDHVKDVSLILDKVRERHKSKKVCVIAHCLGCNVTIPNVIKNKDWFREIIFLAPYYTTKETMASFFSENSLAQLSQEHYTYRKGLYAHASFFNASHQECFIRQINAIPVMINVIIPKKDQFISLDSNMKTFSNTKQANLFYIENADHNFLETSDELIELSVRLLNDEKYTI